MRRLIAIGLTLGAALVASASPVVAAEPHPPSSSRILKVYEPEAGAAKDSGAEPAPPIELTGYRRVDMIGYIYQGKFELVPATGLDNIRYYAQAVAELNAQCPALELEAAKHQIVPYLLSGVTDLVRRFQTGQLSQSEVLQATWMAMLGLNQHWSCQYRPGLGSYDQAQAQCNRAGQDRSELGVLPSQEAAQDITLFLGRHGCTGGAARRLARQLIAFGRIAHTRMHFTERMPSPTSPEGKAYGAIFENCTRPSVDDRAYAWCGCYVRTLYSLKPDRRTLNALAENPFVDGSTYMSWVVRNVPGGEALFDCERTLHGKLDWREAYAPRDTACLVGDKPISGEARECRYRAAWGEFTVTGAHCAAEITSRLWGYRELDCAAGGAMATPSAGPREWRKGIFTMIDYEAELPPDFVPPLPDDARDKVPLQVRLLRATRPGGLKSMSLTVLTDTDLMLMGMPFNLMAHSGAEITAISQEGALILQCAYKAQKGVQYETYWYEQVPQHVSSGRLNPAMQPYFKRIKGAATTCPASARSP